MNKVLIYIAVAAMTIGCAGGGENPGDAGSASANASEEVPKSISEGKGIGEITEVKLNDPLDQDMVKRGKAISEMKCAACHRFTSQRVVGPGWAGLTSKRKPEWIMNMITNVEVMLEKDPVARELLKECLTRMPNQNLSIGDARDVLEFMYQNDLDQAGK